MGKDVRSVVHKNRLRMMMIIMMTMRLLKETSNKKRHVDQYLSGKNEPSLLAGRASQTMLSLSFFVAAQANILSCPS